MATTELNFGPKWLRALSTDGNGNNNSKDKNNTTGNPANSIPNNGNSGGGIGNNNKAKLLTKSFSSSLTSANYSNNSSGNRPWNNNNSEIKYRYSKEEILSYYNRSINHLPPPMDLMEHDEVFVEQAQNPLAMIELSTDEINLLSQSINSDFALKKSNPNNNNNSGEQISGEHSLGNTNVNSTNNTNFKDSTQRMKILNSTSSDLLSRNISGSSSGAGSPNERSKISTNGFIDRNSYRSGVGRGSGSLTGSTTATSSSSTTRSTLRNASNIVFTRLSSLDDTASSGSPGGGSSNGNSSKSNSVFIPKKGSGLQRSTTTGENTNSSNSNSSSSLFMPWRSSSVSSTNSNDTKEWKTVASGNINTNNSSSSTTNSSSSTTTGNENLKSWRNDLTNNLNKIASSTRKDFFGSDSLESSDNQDLSIRKPGSIGSGRNNLDSKSKSFSRRFDSGIEPTTNLGHLVHNHHHSSSSHHRDHQHSYDGSMTDAERDLFGGRGTSSNSNSGTNSVNNGTKLSSTLAGRFLSRDNHRTESNNHFSGKSYDRERGGGPYHQRSSHQYDRFNNRSNLDDSDFFQDRFNNSGGSRNTGSAGGGLDDEDFRRSSIPEWSLEDPTNIDVTRVGTFDASGAFHEAMEDEDDGNEFFRTDKDDADGNDCNEDDNQKTKIDSSNKDSKNNKKDQKNSSSSTGDSKKSESDKLTEITSNSSTSRGTSTAPTSTTTTVLSKPKTIDYFNDPSLSPNYNRSNNNNNGDSNPVSSISNQQQQKQQGIESANIDDSIIKNDNKTRNEIENVILSKHHQQQYNANLLMKNDGDNGSGAAGGNDDDILNKGSFRNPNLHLGNNNDNFNLNDSTFSMIAAMKANVPMQQPLPPSSSSSSTSFKSAVVGSGGASSSSTSLFNSNNSYLNSNPSDISITEHLLNNPLKFSSLLDDFNFDFDSAKTILNPNINNGSSSNDNDPIFHRIASNPSSSSNTTTRTSNNSSIASSFNLTSSHNQHHHDTTNPMMFDPVNLLNFSENTNNNNNSNAAVGGQRFSNLLPTNHSTSILNSVTTLPSKQQISGSTSDHPIESSSNRELQPNLQSSLLPSMTTTATTTNWFYCDPQGQTQGPFTSQEMYDWFNEKYFAPELLVKRASDPKFTKLGDLIQACGGRCPFMLNLPPHPTASAAATIPTVASNPQSAPPIISGHHQPNFSLTPNEPTGSGLFPNFLQQNSGNSQHVGASTAPIQPIQAPILATQSNQSLAPNIGHTMKQFPHPITTPSSHSSFGSGFQMNDSIINSFALFPNLKQSTDSVGTLPSTQVRNIHQTNSTEIDETNILASNTNDRLIDHHHHPQQHHHHSLINPVVQHQHSTNQVTKTQNLRSSPINIPPETNPTNIAPPSITNPSSNIAQDNQMRLFLNHLFNKPSPQTQSLKEEFFSLNTQQREQYLQEKFQQFNLTHNKDQLRPALNDQYHMNQQQQQSSIATTNVLPPASSSSSQNTNNTAEIMYPGDDIVHHHSTGGVGIVGTGKNIKKLSLDESTTLSRQQQQQAANVQQSMKRGQSYETPAVSSSNNYLTNPMIMDNNNSFQRQNSNSSNGSNNNKDETLQMLKNYSNDGNAQPHPPSQQSSSSIPSNNTNNNNNQWITDTSFIPGALSVTEIEELQRREAEERYRNQHQQQQLQANDNLDDHEEFIEVDRKQKNRQQQQTPNTKQQQQQLNNQKKNQILKESPVIGSGNKSVTILQQQQQPSPQQQQSNVTTVIPQMPQLPKKAVWGNQTNEPNDLQKSKIQTLSIAEIQKLQEEKEEEERRQRELQQLNMLQQQQLQQQQRSMKWASQPWQEQSSNSSNIKTLAEIQAEEAEKQQQRLQQLQQQQDLSGTDRRRNVAPLSAIVAASAAKNPSSTSVWNNSNNIETNKHHWDDDNNDHLHHQSTTINNNAIGGGINYKAAVAANNQKSKIDSSMLKHYLKTNPRVIKKIEDSQIMKFSIENQDDLLRYSIDLLNKHFDSIDSTSFCQLLKDLGSPNEVSEYCQSYLGNNNVSMFFAKFFITKKSYLMKLKQEQERNKQQLPSSIPKKNNWNNNNNNNDEDEHHQPHQQTRVINYKSALNNNNNNGGVGAHQSSSNSFQKPTNNNKIDNRSNTGGPSNNGTHIKTAILKTIPTTNKSKGSDDVNLMTIQVESMEEFDKWCLDVLKLNFELNIDAETFVSFLKDIASPDEINDYVQTYLGSNKISRDFAKNFISKRSYLRNKAKKNEPYEDMCGPAPALTPLVNSSSNDNNGFVTVSSSNKKKRSKNKNQNHSNE